MPTTKDIGKLGEDIACTWLKNHDFLVIERNYNKKWGEIDIVAAKDKIIHFIEVKAITGTGKGHRPEENVHETKQKRLKRAIQTYLLEKKLGLEAEFNFHVITISLNQTTKKARVYFMENLIL